MYWEAIPVALVTSIITTAATMFLGERKLRRDYRLEFAAERVARELLMDARWSLRSFSVIRDHLGGFDQDELRRILVRAGTIRFNSESGELWGLLERNRDRLGIDKAPNEPGFVIDGPSEFVR